MKKLFLSLTLILLVLSGCKTNVDPFAYEEPMYGGTCEPLKEKKEGVSNNDIKAGWEDFHINRDYNNAMKHFNEAWYNNSDNPQAYWGIGVVLEAEALQENSLEKLEASLKILEKANAMDPLNPSIMNALGKVLTESAVNRKDAEEKATLLKAAEDLFSTACSKINPKGTFFFNWSVCLYHQERYDEAWNKLVKANELNYKIPPDYLASMKSKLKKQP
ncbi:MAG TPA: hypothetical protein DCZ94_20550 [Lentisphaeria bacterium]|nr:MAG: hypothetical protein A2X48_16395 [Lentisphaerae bacterium GWF2_49_21]HBC89337.1 hypothetical protein [Lentisphaeria bacterium]